MNPLTIHRPARDIRLADALHVDGTPRLVVRILPATIIDPRTHTALPAIEFLHRRTDHPGVGYLTVAAGSSVAVVIQP